MPKESDTCHFGSCGGGILGFIWNGPISQGILHVETSNSFKEMISVPVAQLARSAETDPDMDVSDFSALGVDVETLVASYSGKSTNSDCFRTLFWPAVDEGKKAQLIKVWISEFPKHPRAYLEAFLNLTESAWSPFAYISSYNSEGAAYDYDKTESSIFAATEEEPVQMNSKFPKLQSLMWSWSRSNPFTTYPFFSWTSSVAFFVWQFLLVLTRSIIQRNKSTIAFSMPLLFVAVTSLLGPTVLIRYYWFLFLSAPFLLFLLFSKERLNSSK